MSTTSAEADGVCLENGKPISELKVVELRKELENRNLPKSGNKKELHERLKNYLVSAGEGNKIVGSPFRSAAGSSAHSSPVKSPEPAENPMIAKYRASQEQALRAARQEAVLSRATSTEVDVEEEQQKRKRTESEKTSSSKKSNIEDNEEAVDEPSVVDVPVPENSIADAEPATQAEDTQSDSGGESTKSFIEEPEITDKKAKQDVKAEEEKTVPTQLDEISETAEENKDSSSTSSEDAGKNEISRPSSSSGSATSSKQAEKTDNKLGLKKPVEPVADVESVVLDTQVELDYEEEDEDTEIKQNSCTTKPISESTSQVYTEGVVKVDETTEESKPKTSPKQEVTQNMTPEGFVRVRPASPARNSPSQLIHIRGLKRPFTVKALQNLLGNFGKLVEEGFWIDSIKSNCIVKFETEEQAQLARERLHNVVWPSSSDLSLIVEFSTEEKLTRRREEGKEPAPVLAGFGLTVTVENSASKWKDVDAPPRKISQDLSKNNLSVKGEDKRERKSSRSPSRKRKAVEPVVEPQKTLEDIFKKTNTTPCIYYLPLTEEEAAKRAEKKQKERETAPASKPARNGSERERERENRRRSSPTASQQQQAAGRHRSPDRKRDRRESPPRGYRRH